MIHVSLTACEHFAERVQPCTVGEAYAAIVGHSRAIEAAADFHCQVVRCGTGERLELRGNMVVDVHGRGFHPPQCRSPYRLGEAI